MHRLPGLIARGPLLLALLLLTGLGISTAAAQETSSTSATSLFPRDRIPFPAHTYFQATRIDPRLCPSPACGGVFVSTVNRHVLRCPDEDPRGRRARECLANVVNWSLLGLDPEQERRLNEEFLKKRIIVRGELALDDSLIGITPPVSVLFVREAWRGVTGNEAAKPFFGVVSSGIQCITFPCPTLLRTKLNTRSRPRSIHSVDLASSGASEEQIAKGFEALAHEGLIISGRHQRFVGPAGKGLELVADEFYQRVGARDRACGGFTFPPNPPCDRGEVCDPPPGTCLIADLPGICKPRPEACVEIYDPVCGCDGVTYSNDCERLAAGAALSHQGECLNRCGDTICRLGTHCCNPVMGICTPPGIACTQ